MRRTLLCFPVLLVLCVLVQPAAAQQREPVDPYRLELGQQPRPLRPDAAALAETQARMLEFEEEIRRLRGRLEEAEYANQRLEARLERLEALVEEGAATAEPARAEGGEEPERIAAAPDTAAGADLPVVEPDRAAREGNVLGSIPRDAVLGLPRPNGGDGGELPGEALTGGSQSRYDAALTLLQEGNYAAAGVAFERFLDDFPDDANASSAAFWLGETHYFRQDYADAAAVYARNYRQYGPEAPKAPDNLLKLGMALSALGDKTRACQTFAEIDRRYPDAEGAVARNLERARRSAGCA